VEPNIREALAGFQINALERITPSLEDVFVSLIEARDRAQGTQREVRR
jgi:ABC-2 type transport system ATP-binding protein